MINILIKCPKWLQKMLMYDVYERASESDKRIMCTVDTIATIIAKATVWGTASVAIFILINLLRQCRIIP